jgi:hypothetical protein
MTHAFITLGEELGSGSFRSTYAIIGHDDLVAKLERSDYRGHYPHNESEWALWLDNKRNNRGLPLAPCMDLLDEGGILIMKRTRPMLPSQIYDIPEGFADRHIGNFGWLKNRLVCHDYSCLALKR